MANNLVKWAICKTAKAYADVPVKDANTLYFIEETGKIYRGQIDFTEGTKLVKDFPAAGAVGKIYVKEDTLEGRVWDGVGSAWKTVIRPVVNTLQAENQVDPVSGKAVADYVKGQFTQELKAAVTDISYDKAAKKLQYTKIGAEAPVDVKVDGFLTGAKFDGGTGNLTFNLEGGEDVVVNLPKENFVTSGRYDEGSKKIILTLVDGTVEIPAADLVDVYTGGQTQSATVSVSEGNEITAEVRVSQEGNNAITVKEDGLHVAHQDITGKLDKVAAEKTDEIVVAVADGTVAVSGKKVGGATLTTKDANTVATEAAVEAIRAGLQAEAEAKIAKASIATTIASTEDAVDTKVVSEKAVATALAGVETKKANKADIVDALNPDAAAASADKMASEKAVVDALSWTVIAEAEA